MSTVLWANTLVDGVVTSDESDKYALYKHTKKLQKITQALQVVDFSSLQDVTDRQFNLSGADLPDGMVSTDQLMARDGIWVSGADAVTMLQRLIDHLCQHPTKFGWFKDESALVLAELKESLIVAQRAADANGQFNFSVVT
jgi:hypothetical protein